MTRFSKELAKSIERLVGDYDAILDELAFIRGFVKKEANSLQLEPLQKVFTCIRDLAKSANAELLGVGFLIDDLADESTDFDCIPEDACDHPQHRRHRKEAA